MALGRVIVGRPQLEVVKHAGHRGAPVDDVQLLLEAEGVQADVVGSAFRLVLGGEVDAGEIGGRLCLFQPVPVDHRGGAPVVNLAHEHPGLEHLLGVALAVAVGNVLLGLFVLVIHLVHRALGLLQLLVDHAQNLL